MVLQRPCITELFQHHFAAAPSWIAGAPGRVNLIGEHVDYCGGFVLPMAIDRRTTVAAGVRRADATPQMARIFSAVKGQMVEIPLGSGPPPPMEGWPAYVAGVIAGFHARGVAVPAFDAVIDSTVPLGGGLSSSASLEVAVATVLAGMTGHQIRPLELALLCQRAEHEYAGVPCGIMDQAAAALARENHLLLLDCRSLEFEHVPFAGDDFLVLIANSNVHHALGDGEYARRRADCERAAELLGVASLREATAEQVEAARPMLGDTVFRRARHVVGEIARAREAADAITARRWHDVGRLMASSHASLRDDFEVSCPELDLLVELAVAQPGVIGSRMTGGGFGGCTVSLVEAPHVADVMDAMGRGYERATGRACTMFASHPAAGATLRPPVG